jgi:fructan beta-fructosidase
MFAEPVRELQSLRTLKDKWNDVALHPADLPAHPAPDQFEVEAELEVGGKTGSVGLMFRGVLIEYDIKASELRCADVKAPLQTINGVIRLRVLVDRGSVEVFANDGAVALSAGVIPDHDHDSLVFFARETTSRLNARLFELKSVWTPRD